MQKPIENAVACRYIRESQLLVIPRLLLLPRPPLILRTPPTLISSRNLSLAQRSLLFFGSVSRPADEFSGSALSRHLATTLDEIHFGVIIK